jgi:uncharacterized protein (DUF924 family)
MAELDPRALSVTVFWRDAGEDAWFEKNDAFDADFRNRSSTCITPPRGANAMTGTRMPKDRWR